MVLMLPHPHLQLTERDTHCELPVSDISASLRGSVRDHLTCGYGQGGAACLLKCVAQNKRNHGHGQPSGFADSQAVCPCSAPQLGSAARVSCPHVLPPRRAVRSGSAVSLSTGVRRSFEAGL